MPIYEFYCEDCNTIYHFFSKTINTEKIPACPKCNRKALTRQMSSFAITGKASEKNDTDDMPFDEGKMEKAMQMLAREADSMNEDDPRKAAELMRKLSEISGMQLGDGMNEALSRIERGENPEEIEAQMGDLLDAEDPFLAAKKGRPSGKIRPPSTDSTLYDL